MVSERYWWSYSYLWRIVHDRSVIVRNSISVCVHFNKLWHEVLVKILQDNPDGTISVVSHLLMPKTERVANLVNRSTELQHWVKHNIIIVLIFAIISNPSFHFHCCHYSSSLLLSLSYIKSSQSNKLSLKLLQKVVNYNLKQSQCLKVHSSLSLHLL